MTDNDRNVRTLVVCFVLALAVLVPLRVLKNDVIVVREAEVLGETEDSEVERMEFVYEDEAVDDYESDDSVVLPDADVPIVVEETEE